MLLLLRRGEVVPGAQLIEALWGEEPPGTAQTALHGHISNLRKLLGADRIRTRPPGYLLHAAPGEVDLARFEALIAEARIREDPAERSACLRDALSLWRESPWASFTEKRSRSARSPGCRSFVWPRCRIESMPTWRSAAITSWCRSWSRSIHGRAKRPGR